MAWNRNELRMPAPGNCTPEYPNMVPTTFSVNRNIMIATLKGAAADADPRVAPAIIHANLVACD